MRAPYYYSIVQLYEYRSHRDATAAEIGCDRDFGKIMHPAPPCRKPNARSGGDGEVAPRNGAARGGGRGRASSGGGFALRGPPGDGLHRWGGRPQVGAR